MSEDSKQESAGAQGLFKSPIVWLIVALVAIAIILTTFSTLRPGTVGNSDSTSEFKKDKETGISAYKEGDFKGAVEGLESAVKADPTDVEAQNMLGQSYEATGKLDKAAGAYEAALAEKPGQHEVLYKLAIIHRYQGKHDLAEKRLEEAVEANDQYVAARITLGDVYAKNGKKAKARKMYRSVIEMKPFGVDLKDVRRKLKAVR